MPSLRAVFTADGSQFKREITEMERVIARFSRGVRGSAQASFDLGQRGSQSTIVNPRRPPEAMRDYGEWWQKALLERDVEEATRRIKAGQLRRQRAEERAEEARLASVDEASRRLQAARLRRQRAEQQAEDARTASVDAAERANRARALRRARAEERAEEARLASVDAASRANRAAALRRQRAEERAENQRLADVEAASRANRAAALRRQRAEEREANSFGGRVREFFGGVAGRFMGVGAAIGLAMKTVEYLRESVEMDIAFTRMKNTLNAAAGSATKGGDAFGYLTREANRIGFSLTSVGDDFARFSLAAKQGGLGESDARKIFSSVMSAGAVMGLSPQRQSEALLALEQMLSKTTVSMQELRLQLGNAMPAAVNTFAQALGMSTKELFSQIEAGNILSKDALPKFAEQLNKTFPLNYEDNRVQRDIAIAENAKAFSKANVGMAMRPVTTALNYGTGSLAYMATHPIETLSRLFFGEGQESFADRRRRSDAESRLRVKQMGKEDEEKAAADAKARSVRDFTEKELEQQGKVAQLEKEAAEERERQRMSAMKPEERRAAILDKIRRLQIDIDSAFYEGTDAVTVAQKKLEQQKLRGEADELTKQLEKDKKSSHDMALNLTQNQRLGAFIGGPQMSMVNEQRVSNRLLTSIDRKLGYGHVSSSKRGVAH